MFIGVDNKSDSRVIPLNTGPTKSSLRLFFTVILLLNIIKGSNIRNILSISLSVLFCVFRLLFCNFCKFTLLKFSINRSRLDIFLFNIFIYFVNFDTNSVTCDGFKFTGPYIVDSCVRPLNTALVSRLVTSSVFDDAVCKGPVKDSKRSRI